MPTKAEKKLKKQVTKLNKKNGFLVKKVKNTLRTVKSILSGGLFKK